MQIIEPSVEIYREPDHLRKIEVIARVCTGTQNRVGTKPDFVQNLLKREHMTPFEHVKVIDKYNHFMRMCRDCVKDSPYGFDDRIHLNADDVYINARDFLAIGGTLDELKELPEADDYMTVRLDYPIALSREHIRHREDSFQEMSTRFCKMAGGITFSKQQCFDLDLQDEAFLQACEDQYLRCLEMGRTAQQARMFLPLMTRTTLYITATYECWKHILKLRLDRHADPEMQAIMQMLVNLPDCPVELKQFAEEMKGE